MAREIDSRNIDLRQKPSIDLALDKTPDTSDGLELIMPTSDMAWKEELAFMEEPVEIRVGKPMGQNAVEAVKVAILGHEEIPAIPLNQNVRIKRKFLNVLCMAKPETCFTEVVERGIERDNLLHRDRTHRYPVTILKDTPRGLDWFQHVMSA